MVARQVENPSTTAKWTSSIEAVGKWLMHRCIKRHLPVWLTHVRGDCEVEKSGDQTSSYMGTGSVRERERERDAALPCEWPLNGKNIYSDARVIDLYLCFLSVISLSSCSHFLFYFLLFSCHSLILISDSLSPVPWFPRSRCTLKLDFHSTKVALGHNRNRTEQRLRENKRERERERERDQVYSFTHPHSMV